jgi:hypothetical protein
VVWDKAFKAAKGTHCAAHYQRGLKAWKKIAPPGVGLSCRQVTASFEVAATTYGRIQQCLKQAKGPRKSEGVKPFVEVTPGAKKPKAKHIMLLEYPCDDLSQPMIVTSHKTLASAKRAAARDRRGCFRITTAKEL